MRLAIVAHAVFALSTAAAGGSAPEQLIEAEHWKRARALVEPLYQASPNDARANYLQSRVKAAFGDRPAAIALAEKAVVLDGKDAEYRAHLATLYGEEAARAGMFKGFGLARKFRRENETALSLDPKLARARISMMRFFYQAPGIIGGDKAKAREICEAMIKDDPVHGWRAKTILANLEKEPDLSPYYEKVVEADPRRYDSRTQAANYYLNRDKREDAERHAREALKLDPGRHAAYTLLAAHYALQEKSSEMDATLQASLKAVPDNLYPHLNTGNLLAKRDKELRRAETYIRSYLTQGPEGFSPDHAWARWRLALVLEKQNRKPEAVAELEAALRQREDEEIRKDLKRLRK